MLYEIAHIIRDRAPWLWVLFNGWNAMLIQIRYGRRVRSVEANVCGARQMLSGYDVVPIRDMETERLVQFFSRQPEEAFRFFKPHPFDAKTIRMLQTSRAFLAYALIDRANGRMAGYCFNRLFFHGKGFRGRMVDIDYRCQGLGTMMNRLLNEVGFGIGLRLFETVSKDNVASLRSAVSASHFKVVEALPHNELFLEITNDMKLNNKLDINPSGGGKKETTILSPLHAACHERERRAA